MYCIYSVVVGTVGEEMIEPEVTPVFEVSISMIERESAIRLLFTMPLSSASSIE